jgi:C-terminal processing protease CtpA/Prc
MPATKPPSARNTGLELRNQSFPVGQSFHEKFCIGAQIRADSCGMVIAELVSAGPAHSAGIQVHDVILDIEGQAVRSLNDIEMLMIRYRSDPSIRGSKDGFSSQTNSKPIPNC